MVRPTRERYWNIKYAFEYVLDHHISSDLMQQLLGHAMVVSVLNRSGMAIFRAAYDYAGAGYPARPVWESVKRECNFFLGILPLMIGDLRKGWSTNVTCTDASPDGFGIVE